MHLCKWNLSVYSRQAWTEMIDWRRKQNHRLKFDDNDCINCNQTKVIRPKYVIFLYYELVIDETQIKHCSDVSTWMVVWPNCRKRKLLPVVAPTVSQGTDRLNDHVIKLPTFSKLLQWFTWFFRPQCKLARCFCHLLLQRTVKNEKDTRTLIQMQPIGVFFWTWKQWVPNKKYTSNSFILRMLREF